MENVMHIIESLSQQGREQVVGRALMGAVISLCRAGNPLPESADEDAIKRIEAAVDSRLEVARILASAIPPERASFWLGAAMPRAMEMGDDALGVQDAEDKLQDAFDTALQRLGGIAKEAEEIEARDRAEAEERRKALQPQYEAEAKARLTKLKALLAEPTEELEQAIGLPEPEDHHLDLLLSERLLRAASNPRFIVTLKKWARNWRPEVRRDAIADATMLPDIIEQLEKVREDALQAMTADYADDMDRNVW